MPPHIVLTGPLIELKRASISTIIDYSLRVSSDVKKMAGGSRRRPGRSRVSSKHQITIPVGALREAGLREGDVVQVRAQGPGRVLIARIDDLIDEYAGCLRSNGELGAAIRGLRAEWD